MAYRTTREKFESLAEKALEKLPKEFMDRLKNITIQVEDYPSREEARSVGASRRDLLGLFVGGGYADKDSVFSPAYFPDRVMLYQKNLESFCRTEEELIEEIHKTLYHEIGHYFGMTEDELEQYE